MNKEQFNNTALQYLHGELNEDELGKFVDHLENNPEELDHLTTLSHESALLSEAFQHLPQTGTVHSPFEREKTNIFSWTNIFSIAACLLFVIGTLSYSLLDRTQPSENPSRFTSAGNNSDCA